jgi:hypothetical protein
VAGLVETTKSKVSWSNYLKGVVRHS